MPPRETRWKMEEHTKGKHIVLREYLKAWYPILLQSQERCLFVDGFAGPGTYEDGEPGSPLVALDVFLKHTSLPKFTAELTFLFIELQTDRANALEAEIAPILPRLPGTARAFVENKRFDVVVCEALDELDAGGHLLAPAFVMVDPFGVSDTPLSVLARLLKHPKCELYISVMASWIHRFGTTEEFEQHLTSLYGDETWRPISRMAEATRLPAYLDLYEQKLRASGGTYVLRFDLHKEGAYVYSIFFATKSWMGCSRMKDAIWKISPGGEYSFRGTKSEQLTLAIEGPNLDEFARLILAHLRVSGPLDAAVLDRWAHGDEVIFRKAHLRDALRKLEKDGRIVVTRNGARKGSFTPGVTIEAAPPR